MKFLKLLATAGIFLLLCPMILNYFIGNHPGQHTGISIPCQATEGTREDPSARTRFEWLRLRDPNTNDIPNHIRTRELAWIQKQVRNTPVTDDWTPRGPFHIGGRTKALAIDITDENTILAGGVSAGMWKSTDGGASWAKTTAPGQLHSVSCVAQNTAPGKAHIWYYGTGEGTSFRGGSAAGPLGTNASYRGDGIFKSVDGGESWTQLPSTVSGTAGQSDPFDFVHRILTFGENGILAATSTGLYRSTDEGESWDHVLDFGENYPSTEIAMTGRNVFYATVGGTGPDNGIYRSTDGASWQNISPPDWPDTTTRTVIGPAPSNPDLIYFFTEEKHWKQQLRRYDENQGWTDLSGGLPENGELTTYGGNMLILYVKPDDENTLFLGAVALYRSRDGGSSFELIGGFSDFHVDQHAIAFIPSDPKAMIVGNDGGLFKTLDNTADVTHDPSSGEYHIPWTSLNNGYLTTQFYSVAVNHGKPGSETILGGMQDNAWIVTNSSDPDSPVVCIFPGAVDGGYTAIDDSGDYFYANQGGTFEIWRHAFPGGVHQWTIITPASAAGMGLWMNPFILDPHDTKIMYVASQKELWRNSNLTEIPFTFPSHPTDQNWSKLDHVEPARHISALGMSGADTRRLYYGTIQGELCRLENPHEGQPVPVDIWGDNLPVLAYVHCIAVDPRDADRVMVVFPNYGVISIFASEDAGGSWTPVSGNLEENDQGTGCGPSVRWASILYVDDTPVYFAGTSAGLFSTTQLDSMNTVWTQEGTSTIGNVVVDMIDIRQSDGFVAVGTHGNGVYSAFITEIPTRVNEIKDRPAKVTLYHAYPNPFNADTHIRFFIPESGHVRLYVYNVLGERVAILVDGFRQAGNHHIRWTANELPSGTYIIRLHFRASIATQKVILLR
jgi:photosystem II stability/assembly factor-like uncharacterized protein